ncbi:MAG: hypothetical protein Q4B69_07415 [Slackia sp.]|nr:hypothetical protein [Slackia sp.]
MSAATRRGRTAADEPRTESADARDGSVAGEPSFSCSEEAARLIEARSAAARGNERQHRRERIALAVFVALVLAGFIVLTSYISNAGRGLNIAAANIDDIAGDMSGYDVLLFEGTARKEPSSSRSDFAGAFDRGDKAAPSEHGEASSDDEDVRLEAGAAKTEADAESDVMTTEEARAIYEGKKASVIEVDPDSLRDYVSGRIVMKDGHSYGIFSLPFDAASAYAVPRTTTTKTTTTTIGPSGTVDEKTTTSVKSAYDSVSELFASVDPASIDPALVDRIETVIERFDAAKVDTVVAFTNDPTPFSVVEGVDAVITFKTQERFSMSEMIDGTLYFDAPEVGSVGVLMVAPGNVASTKVLTKGR